MERQLEKELLDEMPACDPRAMRSRNDLQRVNTWMGNAAIMAGMLHLVFAERAPRHLLDLGTGDGTFLLSVARRLASFFPETGVGLLDRQNLVSQQTRAAFNRLGWQAELVQSDVWDWLRGSAFECSDAVVANLFLHHFSPAQLAEVLRGVAKRTRVFIAVEPRRSPWSLAGSRLLRLIGCNDVTRHDARASVRAGFAGRELSSLWPVEGNWSLQERSAGLFSHLFVAHRCSPISFS